VLLQLPAGRAGVASPQTRGEHMTVLTGVPPSGGEEAAPKLQQHPGLTGALGRLPAGARLVIRDTCGREWRISPALRVKEIELREAS
jgi:hypothetical protein